MGRYCSVGELWRLGIPRSIATREFEPGTVSALTFAGTGTGTLLIEYPRDAYAAAIVQITQAGNLGTVRVRLSLDAGATWGPSFPVPDTGQTDTPGRELVLTFGGAGFALHDQWTCSTTASPELALHLAAAEDEADGYLPETLRLPLLAGNKVLAKYVAGLCGEHLLGLRGLDPKSADWQVVRQRRTDALQWLTMVATGQIVPSGLTETPPALYFPNEARTLRKYHVDYPL